MFGWFSDGPRTWKWAVPYFFCLLLGSVSVWMMSVPGQSDGWLAFSLFVGLLSLLSLVIGISNHIWWVNEHSADVKMKLREADAITPRGYLLQQAKGVHPDVLQMILGEQARRWGLVSGTKSPSGEPYAVLMNRPRVTQAFLVYFLRMSNKQTYMPKRTLSDNDHSFDPTGHSTAYEMYDDLESLLVDEMKATRPMGNNKPGYWLGEWDPYSVGMDFGVDINDWEVEDARDQQPASSGQRSAPSSDVIQRALEDLEQTQEMKAKTRNIFGS